MLKITSKQADKVHRLVKDCCVNCDKDGNCILLDDGETHRCVQLISIYGIYCNVVGGGGCLIRNFADYDASRVIINEDICATAKGYEYMALISLKRNGGAV